MFDGRADAPEEYRRALAAWKLRHTGAGPPSDRRRGENKRNADKTAVSPAFVLRRHKPPQLT